MAEKENIYFAPDLLAPYAHWITPEIEIKRFDTRFLLARIPAHQKPVHCEIENDRRSLADGERSAVEIRSGRNRADAADV